MYFLITFFGFLLASFYDLKTREVPRLLTFSLIFLGLSLHGVESVYLKNLNPFISSFSTCFLCFCFAFLLYKIGAWAGGDVKLFTGLGALLPFYGKISFFPFIVFVVSFLAAFPFLIMYVAYFFIKRKKLRRVIKNQFKGWMLKEFYSIPFMIIISAFFSKNFIDFFQSFLQLFFLSVIFFLGIASFKIARTNILREKIKVKELKEGMIPAQSIFLEKGRIVFREQLFQKPAGNLIVSSMARGLTEKEIKRLKELKVEEIIVKKSIPFVPIITLSMLLIFCFERFFV